MAGLILYNARVVSAPSGLMLILRKKLHVNLVDGDDQQFAPR
jgi:hypothetical protein